MTKRRSQLSLKIRFSVLSRGLFRCHYCGASSRGGAVLEVDHVVPVSKGGSSDIGNLVPACWDCNRGKGAMSLPHLTTFAEWLLHQAHRDDPVGDLAKDAGPELEDCRTWQDVRATLVSHRACREALLAAVYAWREFRKAKRLQTLGTL